jgi:zinc protease
MATLTRTLARNFARALVAALSIGSAGVSAAELPAFRPPVPVVRTLPNGLRIAVFQDRRLPLVQMRLLLPAGVAQEAAETPGVANATAQLLRAGTSSRTAGAFAADVDFLGGSVNGTATRDYSAVVATFLSADFEAGLELLADAVVNPIFPPEEVDRFRAQVASLLLPARQNPASQAEDRLWALAFEGHPYGRNPLGTPGPSGQLDREAVRAFHRDFYRPDRAVLAIAGDVELERAFSVANDRFGNWAGRAAPTPPLSVPAPPAAMRIQLVDRPGLARSEVRIGLVCPSRADLDALPLQVANYILGGGGFSSRLTQALRVEGGLSYDVRSNYTILRDAGLVSLGTVARNDSVATLVARMRDELARLRTQPPGEAEVAAARRYFENSYPLQFQTPGALLAQWMGADFHGLTSTLFSHYVENVGAVTVAQVAATSRWLDPSRCVVVVVGPAAELKAPLEALGPVEVAAVGGGPVVAAPAAPAPASPEQKKRGRELLARTLVAHGGLERLRRVKDTTIEGDMLLQLEDNSLTVTLRQIRKEPFRMRYSTRVSSMENGQVLNGMRGWMYSSANDSTQVMDADSLGVEALRAVFRSDVVHSLLAAAEPAAEVAWLGPGRADGRVVDLLEVTTPAPPGGGPAEQRLFYLDSTGHRLIAEDLGDARMRASPAAVRRVYRDYRMVAGVPWPFYEERLRGGTKTMTLSLQSVTINTGVSDRLFERPAQTTVSLPAR